jgi:uncharacterized protein
VSPLDDPSGIVDLLDWKRRIFELYASVRATDDPRQAWATWRSERDGLFRTHPSSPIPDGRRRGFRGLSYFDYDPQARVLGEITPAEPARFDITTSGDETLGFTRFATARFELAQRPLSLELYWLDGYGGGLFIPFADTTSRDETYGAGRYLLDTVKGSDLGLDGGRLVLDFNFAYNPSCAYDPRWVCPLAPPPNRLDVAVRAGEKTPAEARP